MSSLPAVVRPMPLLRRIGPPDSAPARILVVDDEAPCRHGLQHALHRHGFRVSLAADGREALAVLRDVGADLVITALLMPCMDGLELLLRLSQATKPPRAIAICGPSESEGLSCSASERGADAILVKPFSEGELLACVRRALGRSR